MFGSLPTGVVTGTTCGPPSSPHTDVSNYHQGQRPSYARLVSTCPLLSLSQSANHFPRLARFNMNYQYTVYIHYPGTRSPGGAWKWSWLQEYAFLSRHSIGRDPQPPSTKRDISTTSNHCCSRCYRSARLPFDLNETDGTLRQFQEKFSNGEYSNPLRRFAIYTLSPKDTVGLQTRRPIADGTR